MDYSFETRIDVLDFGKYFYTVVYLDKDIEEQLPFKTYPRPRIDAEINDHPIEGACQPSKVGAYYLILGKKFLKAAELSTGDIVEVRFCLGDQDALDMPPSLQIALNADSDIGEVFESLSIGKKRALVHRVASAKTEPTRDKRIKEVEDTMQDPTGSPLARVLGFGFKGLQGRHN